MRLVMVLGGRGCRVDQRLDAATKHAAAGHLCTGHAANKLSQSLPFAAEP